MKYVLLLIALLSTPYCLASKKAVTDEGDVVILNDDGTWHFENATAVSSNEIATNPKTFTKSSQSKFQLKSTHNNSTFWINPKIWGFKKNDNGHDAAEYTFTLKGADLYAMAITEKIEIKVEELAKIAVENAKNAAPDIKVKKKEYRMVNGKKVIYMEMEGTIQSVKFTYLGYYYSNASGSTQYLAYTGSNLVKGYRKKINEFLNGLN